MPFDLGFSREHPVWDQLAVGVGAFGCGVIELVGWTLMDVESVAALAKVSQQSQISRKTMARGLLALWFKVG